jgi:hypothetical protein
MAGDLMAGVCDLPNHIRKLFRHPSQDKEGGTTSIGIEDRENLVGVLL